VPTPVRAAGRGREVALDVEKRGAGDVTLEIELAPALRPAELPPAVHEQIAHAA
jgi:hypothetical protein